MTAWTQPLPDLAAAKAPGHIASHNMIRAALQEGRDRLDRLRPLMSSWPVWIYGNSYSLLGGAGIPWMTAGKHYSQIASDLLDGGAVTSYGVSGRRIVDVVGTLINGSSFPGCSGAIAAGKWPGVSQRSGLVILESAVNDFGHYPSMATATPAAVTTAYRNAMKAAYRTALAYMSSESRVEQSTCAVTLAWTRNAAVPYASNTSTDFTTTVGATATYTVTPPQSGPFAGTVFLGMYVLDPAVPGVMAQQEIRVDGVLQTTRTPAAWEQYVGHTGANVNIGPDAVAVQLPVDGSAHTIELKHAGSSGQYMYNDAVLIPSADPNPIAVMGAEHTVLSWNGIDRGRYHDNVRIMTPDLKSVVAEFPNAFWVTSTMTTSGLYSGDGIHPNDRGHAQRANDLIAAMNSTVRARLQNRALALRPNSDFAIL